MSINPEIPRFPLGSIDTHVHSRHSWDCRMHPAAAVQAARAAGLRALVFTEHADFDPSDESNGFYDAAAIAATLSEFKIQNSEFKVFRGIEIGYQPRYEGIIRDFIALGKFDFVIGSVHLVGPHDLSRPEKQEEFFRPRTQQHAYRAYLDAVEQTVASGLFDCLGHLDLCKRYGHKFYGPMAWRDFEPQVTRILNGVLKNGMYLEINTSGLRQDPGEPYPSIDVIREYRALGGTRLTLGSDAHFPEHVGFSFSEICGILNTE